MVSTASIAKHPVHPMLVPLPIGMWVFSLACDILMLRTGNVFWGTSAFHAMTGGVIAALLAALPGLVDLFTLSPSRPKTIGLWHMTINLTIVATYVANLLWRRHTPVGMETWQLLLSAAAILLLGASGWLGGEMVYVHGIAVDPAGRHKL